MVLDAAHRLVKVDRHGNADHLFYDRLCRVFLTFGIHPSKVPGLTGNAIQKRPTERGDRFFLVWIRPKAQAKRRQIEIEVPGTMIAWLPEFLDATKPVRRESYWRMMKEVEWEVGQMGYSFKVNPLRFRHTCARELIAKGFSSTDVRAMLGVTQDTLDRYALSTPEMRGEKAESVGWGTWT